MCKTMYRCLSLHKDIRTYMHRAQGDVLDKDSTCVTHIYRACTCKHNYTYKEHTRRRQVTVAPACRTDSRRVLLDNAPVDGWTDGRTDRRTYTGYCPVPGRSRACAIGFVSTRFLSKDVSYAISITCHISFSFFPTLFYTLTQCFRDASHPVVSIDRVSEYKSLHVNCLEFNM